MSEASNDRTFPLRDGRILRLRPATPADAPALVAYRDQVSGESNFLSFGPGERPVTVEQEEAFVRELQETDNGLLLLALLAGELVGVLTFRGGDRPRLRHAGGFGISVRRPYWGLGIGSLLLDELIRWARAGGVITKINLRTRTDNERAIRLYEAKGFVREGTISRDLRIDGVYYDNYWMGLEL